MRQSAQARAKVVVRTIPCINRLPLTEYTSLQYVLAPGQPLQGAHAQENPVTLGGEVKSGTCKSDFALRCPHVEEAYATWSQLCVMLKNSRPMLHFICAQSAQSGTPRSGHPNEVHHDFPPATPDRRSPGHIVLPSLSAIPIVE